MLISFIFIHQIYSHLGLFYCHYLLSSFIILVIVVYYPTYIIIIITWRAESSWNGSHERRVPKRKSRDNNHPELYPGQFDFLCNASPSQAPTWSRSTFSLTHMCPTHSSPYALISLCTCLPTHLSPYTLVSLRTRLPTYLSYHYVRVPAERTFRLGIYLKSSTCRGHPRLSQYAIRTLSCRLDAINAPPLYGSQPRHQSTRVTGWTRSGHLQYVISLMMKDHLQYAIEYLGKLAPWQRSDGYPPSACHQDSQQWLDDKGVTDIYPSVGHQYWPEPWPDDEGKPSGLAMLARW